MDFEKNFGVQITGLDGEGLLSAIQSAKTIKEMNSLRINCVKEALKTPQSLLSWQKKYQQLKTCPTCGMKR